jgi:hypothetical protein
MAGWSHSHLASSRNLTIGMCGATFVASVIIISTLVSGSSDIEAKTSILAPGNNFEQRFPAETASQSVDCRQQTWPYIESSCLRQQTPGREVRFVTDRQTRTQTR